MNKGGEKGRAGVQGGFRLALRATERLQSNATGRLSNGHTKYYSSSSKCLSLAQTIIHYTRVDQVGVGYTAEHRVVFVRHQRMFDPSSDHYAYRISTVGLLFPIETGEAGEARVKLRPVYGG